MSMRYDFTFEHATIPPENYGRLIDWAPEDVADDPEHAATLALEVVNDHLSDWDGAEQDSAGIHLDSHGFHDSASYGYSAHLEQRGIIALVAEVLDDRDSHAAADLVRDTDPDDDLWNNYIGPMIDEIEEDYTNIAEEMETEK